MSPAKETAMDNWKGLRVHFVGIGGAGMSSLARILHAAGALISGSDLQDSPTVQTLRAMGIPVAPQHDPANIPNPCHLTVATAAVHPANPELNAARLQGTPILKYAQLLGRISRQKHCIAVSGCHGKTTTTGLVGYILQQAGLDPAIVVGGCVEQIGGHGRPGAGPHFVVEACEFDRSFHSL
ncbi:MAG TPA: Mur ligase domain-containing protein, partial [Candidatus Brocadiia bacterium]|nr:Mur ligase domain-containing protein [Candidatus Brocadiia bacterium]